MTPVCSVCIANFNGVGMIEACIESVLAQDCSFPVEILVHDDASTDDSVELIRARYPQVILIESRENVGFCIANNRMAAVGRGAFLMLLNNDAELLPDALRLLYEAAQASPKPAILSLPQYDFASGQLVDRGCFLDPFFNPVPNLEPTRRDVAMAIGACLWVPKSLWLELEGFPEWFGSIAEDMLLCCRARLAGYSVQVLRHSGYRHRSGASFGGGKADATLRLATTKRRRRLSERNKTMVMLICHPMPLLLTILPFHLLLIHIEGIILTLLCRDRSIWQEIYAPLLPNLLHHRAAAQSLHRQVQTGRKISLWQWLDGFNFLPRKLVMLFRYGIPRLR